MASGSHGTLYLGDRFTVVKDLEKELGPGLLSDMYKQLGIRVEGLVVVGPQRRGLPSGSRPPDRAGVLKTPP